MHVKLGMHGWGNSVSRSFFLAETSLQAIDKCRLKDPCWGLPAEYDRLLEALEKCNIMQISSFHVQKMQDRDHQFMVDNLPNTNHDASFYTSFLPSKQCCNLTMRMFARLLKFCGQAAWKDMMSSSLVSTPGPSSKPGPHSSGAGHMKRQLGAP